MNGIARGAEEPGRLALALLLALGLHAAALLGIPAEGWSLRYLQPPRFDVTLLPPMEQLNVSESATAAPGPVAPAAQPSPAVAVALPEPVTPTTAPLLVTPPLPAPIFAPPPAPIFPPKPVAATQPAPKPVTPVVAPAKPPVVVKITPAPRATVKTVKPVAPPKPAPSPVLPAKPIGPPHAAVESSVKPPAVKPSSPPRFTPAQPSPPSAQPPAYPPERSKRGGVAGTGTPGRLDSTALLGQIVSLDAETQQRASRAAREKRVSLADTRSLAGFYAADWVRKVTRVGEMNFPDAARRLNLSAGPLLDVAIRADGSLRDVRILRSSGSVELDRAARRIVELAAPYPPFPPELRQQVELLRIEAPWRFDPGGRVQVR